MHVARRALFVLLVGFLALAVGYGTSRLYHASDRRPEAPVIDLDNLPPAETSPTTVERVDGATIVPPPILGSEPTAPALTSPTSAPATPTPTPTNPPPPPPPPPGDDDGDDDNDDGEPDD